MQQWALRTRSQNVQVGFVPTMGYLHAGHASLMDRARRLVGTGGRVVVSIYVNPTQFGPREDLSRYPRDFRRDQQVCRQAGVDAIFYPTDAEMYPGRLEGTYSTYVSETSLSLSMEGASRPTHFQGVTTIVAKLFNLVLPNVAVFGQKDFQQAAVIQRMTRDLNFPVRVVVAPTMREGDGLAMSSRNAYLSPAQRVQARCLSQALRDARTAVRSASAPVSATALTKRLRREIEMHPEARVDYLAFFDPSSLRPVTRLRPGVHMALAVFVGKTRLIDNASL